jgi:ABC-type polysaccharide/polyol phosphate export permease/4-amino-4-deoxy-L-arabinose transferase-like glycosyltransferase
MTVSDDFSARLITLQIVIVLAIAGILRLHHITQPFIDVFSWRQASTAMIADNFYRTNWNIFYPEVNWGGPGPNYQGREFQTASYIAARLYTIIGQHDWVGRSVAVAFGLWGIFALYQLVRRVWDEERAIASAAVMAVLPGSIFVERSFLPDPAMVALMITSFWMLVAYLQTERQRYLLLAGVIGAWGLLTKIPGLIVGLPMVYATLTILSSKRKLQPAKLVMPGVVGILALAPVIGYYLWARHLSLSYPPYHFAGSGNWLWNDGLKEWWDQNYFVPSLQVNFYYWLWTAPMIYFVSLGLLLRPPGRERSQRSGEDQLPINSLGKAPWLFHWWLLAGVFYYFIGAKELVDNPWNFHIINPVGAALAGHAIVSIASLRPLRTRPPASRVAVAVFLLIIGGVGQSVLKSMYNRPYGDESYRLGLALRQVSQPGDLVVTMASDLGDPNAIYYSQRRGWIFPPASNDIAWNQLPEDDNEAIRMFEDLRAKGADWLGIASERKKDFGTNHPALVEHIKRTCQFHSQTPQYVIYRILSPTAVAKPALSQDQTPARAADTPPVTQEIRYRMPEAGEVFLVWGINGWAVVTEETRPAGTRVKDALMYSPMAREGDTFIARVQAPSGATIDYVFQITKMRGGAAVDVWDTHSGQDYHSIAAQDGVVDVQTSLALAQDRTLVSTLDAALPWLLGLGAVLGMGAMLIIHRNSVMINTRASLYTRRLFYLRDLLRELVSRDMKLRYKRSVLGIAWSLFNPLAQLLIFIFLFRRVLPLNIPNYPLFVFSGVLAWSWFQSSLLLATGSITDNRELIRRPGFPAAILPVVAVTSNMIHFLLALPILLLFLVLSGLRPTGAFVALPLVIAVQFLLILSLAYLVATFHVTFRDTQHLLGVLLLLLFYLTPVFYDASTVPERYRLFYRLNPMMHMLDAYRTILIRGELPDGLSLLGLAALTAGLLGLGYAIFTRASYRFVEEL